ncbi:tubby C-terminal-like domain-containing protein [Aspergillus keveii]|uniref:Tubby C-terminal-like domain-containing protein n=1 Tax=Aspergillus keveii TaxID=714993 RepID=A0ABR4FN41_9EURO
MSQSDLRPVSQPVMLFEQFIARDRPQTLVLKEKILSLTGDSFDIKLDNGLPVLKVNAAFFSLSGRKRVEDMNGNHLYNIRKELLHLLHPTYVLEDPSENKILEVRSSVKFFRSKATATYTDPRTGRVVTLVMEGNWLDHVAKIVHEETGETVASIFRERFNARNLIFGQDTYRVTVAQGVDMALIAGLCICFDEKNNER